MGQHQKCFWWLLIWAGWNALCNCETGEAGGSVELAPGCNVQGQLYTSEDNSSLKGYAYHSIRYGVTERFRPSVLNRDHSYLRNLSRSNNACPVKQDLWKQFNLTLSEDCLYLDIYVPPRPVGAGSKLPTMIYFHGGGLDAMFRQTIDGSHLAAAIDVIVVVVGSRLDAFGYLTTGDEVAKGNYGLGDCKVAIEWVVQNIQKFGGDPGAVSIFGQSTGGATVSALFLDKKVRGSLRAAMAMSGSVFSEYSFVINPKQYAMELAEYAGCNYTEESAEIVDCLRGLSMESFLDAMKSLPDLPYPQTRFVFAVDGEHIPEAPAIVITRNVQQPFAGNNARFINGFMAQESADSLEAREPSLFAEAAEYTFRDAKAHVLRYLTRVYTPCPSADPQTAQKLLDFYNISEADNVPSLRRKLIHMLTDSHTTRIMKEAFLYANRRVESGMSSQLYRISYDFGCYHKFGAAHSYEVNHIFGGPLYSFSMPGYVPDKRVASDLREMVRQVAYNGRLNGSEFNASQKLFLDYTAAKTWQPATMDFSNLLMFWDGIIETCRYRMEKMDLIVNLFV